MPWTAAANTVALLVMFGYAKHLPPDEPAPAPQSELLQATPPAPPKPADQITIKQQLLHQVPGPRIPPLPPPSRTWPDRMPLAPPDPTTKAVPLPLLPTPPLDPLQTALDAALVSSEGTLPQRTGLARLLLPRAGAKPDLGEQPGTVVVAAGDESAPGDGYVRLDAGDPVFRQPHDVRRWWRDSGSPAIWLLRSQAAQRVIWFGPEVRAGWLAGRREAVNLLRNALADARLTP